MGTLTLDAVIDGIMVGDLDGEEKRVYEAFKQRHRALSARAGLLLDEHDHVQIAANIRGITAGLTGVITRPARGNRKRPVVRIDDTPEARARNVANVEYTYPARCLTKIEAPAKSKRKRS